MAKPLFAHTDCDDRVADWIRHRASTAGPPSCATGCARCCHQAVTATSAEAIAILDARLGPGLLDAVLAHAADVRSLVRHAASPSEARRRIGAIGSCPLLVNARCSVYAHRPMPCRTLHVWHGPDRCGHDDGREDVPRALDAIRDHALVRSLRDDVLAGRRPFFGQLTLTLELLATHREGYAAGADLRGCVPTEIRELELLEFLDAPDRDGMLDELRAMLTSIPSDRPARVSDGRARHRAR